MVFLMMMTQSPTTHIRLYMHFIFLVITGLGSVTDDILLGCVHMHSYKKRTGQRYLDTKV